MNAFSPADISKVMNTPDPAHAFPSRTQSIELEDTRDNPAITTQGQNGLQTSEGASQSKVRKRDAELDSIEECVQSCEAVVENSGCH